MEKKQFYSVPETQIFAILNPVAIMAQSQSSEAGTTPFDKEDEEYDL